MLPVCSAAPCCSSLHPVHALAGPGALYPVRKILHDRSIIDERHFFCMEDGTHSQDLPMRVHATGSFHSLITERPSQPGFFDSSIFSPLPNEFDDIVHGFSNDCFDGEAENSCYSLREVTAEPLSSVSGDDLPNMNTFIDQSGSSVVESTSSGSSSTFDVTERTISEISVRVPVAFEGTNNGISQIKGGIEYSISKIAGSVDALIDRAQDALVGTYNALTLSASDAIGGTRKAVDGALNGLLSSVDSSKNEAAERVIDILRRAIFTLEDSLVNAATYVVSSYGSVKLLLPPNIRDVLNLSEEKAIQILSPVGAAFQQVYIIIEGFERSLGLDPADPIVQFTLLIGSSATVGVSYWVFTYGGYSGDLAPELTLELLKNDKSAVLIDVRPEDMRERDGIPDFRRGARSKYASVTAPEVGNSVRKMLKAGRDFDNALLAVVIRSLKTIKADSKVIIMDANGTQSKSIARCLKRLGVKKPYLVKGGYQSWVKKSLRIKELKPETTLTLLNEEAEAILEEIKPTPTLIIGYALGLSTAVYALLEWEKTLQLIGIVGLGLTLYRRFTSYQDSEDLKQDVRLLLAPVRLGTQAFSWASRKLEPNKIGLPTSPSTTAVHDRVIQAAAKHESQPSDAGEPSGPANENLVSEG